MGTPLGDVMITCSNIFLRWAYASWDDIFSSTISLSILLITKTGCIFSSQACLNTAWVCKEKQKRFYMNHITVLYGPNYTCIALVERNKAETAHEMHKKHTQPLEPASLYSPMQFLHPHMSYCCTLLWPACSYASVLGKSKSFQKSLAFLF